jgi:predicted nuclease of predicted toxin-antitoxin system
MKLLLDNNLSFKLVQSLQNYFPGSQHIRDVLSINADDYTIWNHAKTNGFTILTKDNDFDERSKLEGCPPKIIHLICGNKTTLHILNLLIWRKAEILIFGESDSENCILKIS